MFSINREDTIAAISTPLGESGIGIVRLSGKNALKISDRIFFCKKGLRPSQFPSFTIHYGFIAQKPHKTSGRRNKIIDEVLLSVMRSPHSYTREDIVEINCHGGIVPLKKILELVLKEGARLARPGEFSMRAFLNGRIDLSQAEAVLNIIRAKTDTALNLAVNQLQGALSLCIKQLRENLLDLIVPLEAGIDFPDEHCETRERKRLVKDLRAITVKIDVLIENADKGILLQNGISIVIAGRPNVGKSSLMNRLLDCERVIVTSVSGTTRDVVEETVVINNLPVRIADTAGIIDSNSLITRASVNRSLAYLKKADLVLFVLDGSRQINRLDLKAAKLLQDKKVLIVINKSDLKKKIDIASVRKILPGAAAVKISALKNSGIDVLKEKISGLFFAGSISNNEEILVISLRHKQALQDCRMNIINALNLLTDKGFDECVIFELKQAITELGWICGENLAEDILDRIFSKFCIGK